MLLASLSLAASLASAAPRPPVVAVDPRIELLSLVYELAVPEEDGRSALVRNKLDYRGELRARFAAFASDPVVETYRKLRAEGLDAITALAFVTKAFDRGTGAFREDAVPTYVSDAFNTQGTAERWLELVAFGRELEAFGERSGFRAFFTEKRRFYAALEDMVRGDLNRRDAIGEFERYSGVPVDVEYHVYVCPVFGGYASSIDHASAKPAIAGYLGPEAMRAGKPVFRYSGLERKIWQELAHAAIDAESERYPEKIDESKRLFDTLPGVGHCGSWRNCVRQYSARAVGYRVLALHPRPEDDAEDRKAALTSADEVTAAVAERLKEYEAQRRRYRDLKAFYPRMLDAFSEVAARR